MLHAQPRTLAGTPTRAHRRLVATLALGVLVLAAAALAAPAAAATPPDSSVAAQLNVPSIPRGSSALVSGTVTPASPGETVALEQWSSAAGWEQLRTGMLDGASAFHLDVMPTTTGLIRLRVRKLAGAASAEGTSASLSLKVYRVVVGGICIAGPGLNGEYLELRNVGTTDVNIGTWTISHARLGWTLHLRPYLLRAGQRVRIYSGSGISGQGRLFLFRRISVWRSSRNGDLIVVGDGYGQAAAIARFQRS